MFDNLFTSSPTAWTALIAGVIALPLLIHLINLLRHKTVKWAAMEFLLKSDKQNRNWVRLKQMMLLLSRIAILLLALLMFAQVGCGENRIAGLLGGSTTHHYVVFDDSFSMSASDSTDSVFDRARSTLSMIAARASNRPNQLITILRASSFRNQNEVGSVGPTGWPPEGAAFIGQAADFNSVLVDDQIGERIKSVKSRLAVSNLASGLTSAVDSVAALISERKNENAIVYVLSDFREKDWRNPQDIRSALETIERAGAGIELIRCEVDAGDNLAITELRPAGNVRVAGTPMMMMVRVKNCGSRIAEKIQLKINSIAFADVGSRNRREPNWKLEELPTVFFSEIPPGQSATRLFPVFFATPGQHVVFADLPVDAIAVDNRRWSSMKFRSAAKVLVIDDEQQQSRFLSLALNPNRMTGIQPETRSREFLRNNSPSQLADYDVIFLLDVDRLDEAASENLEAFVSSGGGLGIFLGPKTDLNFYNQRLFNDGAGLLPISLGKINEVPEQLEDPIADIAPESHPIFAPLMRDRNSLLSLVQIEKLVLPGVDWFTEVGTSARVLATVRGKTQWPLIIEKTFGDGRVILVTTTAGPIWNNWSRNATFPPTLLLLEDYLAQENYRYDDRLAGQTIPVEIPASEYLAKAVFERRLDNQMSRLSQPPLENEILLRPASLDPQQLVGVVGRYRPTMMSGATDEPGIYDLTLTKVNSAAETTRLSINVDGSESEMALVDMPTLLSKVAPAQPNLVDWDQFNPEPEQNPVSSLGRLFLLMMVGLLVTEQVLAYSSSYHQK